MTQRNLRRSRPVQGLNIYNNPISQYQARPNRFPMESFTPQSAYNEASNPFVSPGRGGQVDFSPLISNNPATPSIILFKQLTAYPNYGNPSRNADILYTGNLGAWTFEAPAFLSVPGNMRAQIIIRAVLDDHANVSPNRYSARITINGIVVHNGRLHLEHGSPAGGIFTNWKELTCNVSNPRRVNQVIIQNTSFTTPDNWIGFDWMELRFLPRSRD